MESVEKLRKWRRDNTWGDGLIHLISMQRELETKKFDENLEAIEQEVSERYELLPVDVDGIVWKHTDNTFIDNDGYEHTLISMKVDRAGNWILCSYGSCYQADECRHVKSDPIKRLLEEFAACATTNAQGDVIFSGRCIDEYTDKLHELLGGEES